MNKKSDETRIVSESTNDFDSGSFIKLSKKKGRPKKNETAVDPDKSQDIIPVPILEESRSGRKHKKKKPRVNRKANEETLVDSDINMRVSNAMGNIEPGNSVDISGNTSVVLNYNYPIVFENTCPSENSGVSKNQVPENFENDSGKSQSQIESLGTEEQESFGDVKKLKPMKNKYKFTGQTVEMFSSVFSAALKNLNGDEDTEGKSEMSPQEPPERRRGRYKKGQDRSSVDFVAECDVICAVCGVKLANSEWLSHNEMTHFNLAWRKGETNVDVDNDTVVKNRLKGILRKVKILVCPKCGHSCDNLNSFIMHRETCAGILINGFVTCAVCNLQIERNSWLNHKLKMHNNLTWRMGDIPLNMNDKHFVLSVLNALYKMKKPLYCDKCNQTKKSVLGFLSHRSQCGIDLQKAKIQCTMCNKKVLPVSMPSHIKMVHEAPKKQPVESDYFNVDSNAPIKKRQAAKGAFSIIDSLSKSSGGFKATQMKQYTSSKDFKEEEFVISMLKNELKEFTTIQCKFNDCDFASDKIESLMDHMKNCTYKPEEFYMCLKCSAIKLSEEEIRIHITDVHDEFLPEVENDDISTSDEEQAVQKTILNKKKHADIIKLQKDINYKVKPRCIFNVQRRKNCLFVYAFDYTWDFCLQHYNQPTLFNNLRLTNSEWVPLDEHLIEKYLPAAEKSCEVARKRVSNFENVLGEEVAPKQFDLFEVDHEDVNTTIFCGGPINALAWLPTPHRSLQANQILAVAACNKFESKYKVNENYKEPSVIQFWNFGILANHRKYSEPNLAFCLAVDYGPVWHLEWCPSGCFDQHDSECGMTRAGLLAVAGSVPFVYIYSIPFVEEEQMGLIYKEKPILKLELGIDSRRLKSNFYPTKISWSKASGHTHIAVGYTDGMVAVFDLQSTSKLLKFQDKKGLDVLLPYKVIKAHKHYISALSLIHFKGGAKWLLTASFDKYVHWWDLENDNKLSIHRKKIISDATWLTNWVAHISTSDESSTVNNFTNTLLVPHRNYLSDPVFITYSHTTLTSISSTDWLNGFVHSSSAGEITAVFPHQMLYSFETVKRGQLPKYPFSYAKLIDKQRCPEDSKTDILKAGNGAKESSTDTLENSETKYSEPISYEEAEKKYTLVFCDFIMNQFEDFHPSLQATFTGQNSALQASKPHMYPLQAVNKVCFNPNRQASLYFATGYQAGFVRVTYLKFLEGDSQVKRSMECTE
ncbi:hypothetical protein JTB14_011827 [Gonioctena quinquepunctata]|nr:hypothetical protein JTB14_011827 [Gonioctena quinquepunctata]